MNAKTSVVFTICVEVILYLLPWQYRRLRPSDFVLADVQFEG